MLEGIKIEGTGFFVNTDGYFVTAGHVAKAVRAVIEKAPTKAPAVVIPQKDWGRGSETFDAVALQFRVVRIDEERDLALCRTTLNPFLHPETKEFVRSVALDENVPPDGTEVAFTGFPMGVTIPMSSKGILASYTEVSDRGVVLVLQADSWPGASGSPVFVMNGQVIGLVLAHGQGRFEGGTLARPAAFIKTLLFRLPKPRL